MAMDRRFSSSCLRFNPAHENPNRMIVDRFPVTGAGEAPDMEAIVVGPDGNFWLGSEGNADSRPNLVLKVNVENGEVNDALPYAFSRSSRV